MLQYIIIGILFLSTLIATVCVIFDESKKRKMTYLPTISFILPTYKDGHLVEKSIQSIKACYPAEKTEIVVINDCSPDNTQELLDKLKEKYPEIKLLKNEKNIGKSASVNEAFKHCTKETIFILDTDTSLVKSSLIDLLARLQEPKVGAVSCRYKALNSKGFIPRMVDVEYSMLSFIQGAYNCFSTISLWGGCMAFKRKAFEDIGGLAPNFITEDMHAALCLHDKGWKVEQSSFPIYTEVPEKMMEWYKQKKRWGTGFMQNFITHFKLYITHPLGLFFTLSYFFFMILFLNGMLVNGSLAWHVGTAFYDFMQAGSSLSKGAILLFISYFGFSLGKIIISISFQLFSLPFLLYDDYYRHIARILWIFPYTLIYMPIYSVINIWFFIVGIKRYFELRGGSRAW